MNTKESANLALSAALGSDGLSAVTVVGLNPNPNTTGLPKTINENAILLVPPTAARVHNISSSSANDTSAGTGARTVQITGVNGSWVETTETVTMNGTSNVATVNSYLFINEVKCLAFGSGGTNAGAISATAVTDSTVSNYVAAGRNISLTAAYAVPAGKTAYIASIHATATFGTAAGSAVRVALKTKGVSEAAFYTRHTFWVQANGTSNSRIDFPAYFKVAEKSIIRLDVDECIVNNTPVTGGFDMVLKAA